MSTLAREFTMLVQLFAVDRLCKRSTAMPH